LTSKTSLLTNITKEDKNEYKSGNIELNGSKSI
jgi:hypothetical protein